MKKFSNQQDDTFVVQEENLVAVISEEEFRRAVLPVTSWDRFVVFAVKSDNGNYLAWFNSGQWVKVVGEPII